MKIVHECLNEIVDFDIYPIYSLIIENSDLFYKLTRNLSGECAVCTLEERIFCCSWMECSVSVN